MIADNKLAEIATWDDRLLAEQLQELSVHGLDFNIEVTGFEMGEIDLRIASLEEPPESDDDPTDVVPEVSAGPPLSKNGDLWVLDRHRLLCGSALETPAFAALMGGEQAAMGFTDPPYNVRIDGHASGLGAIHHRPFPMASGEMDGAEFTAFLAGAFRNLAAFSVDGSLHYICMDWRHVEELLAAGRAAYGELKNLCVWVKVQRFRLFGQLPGRNKLKGPGSRLLVSPFPEIKIHPVLLRGAVKLVGSRRPVGKVGETHSVFPGLSIGDRAARSGGDRRSRLSTNSQHLLGMASGSQCRRSH
jgi:hypothetical protein